MIIANEADAWREVAKRFAKPHTAAGCDRHGLCTMICAMSGRDELDRQTGWNMRQRVKQHILVGDEFETWAGYAWDTADRDVRVLAALFLELEARDDPDLG